MPSKFAPPPPPINKAKRLNAIAEAVALWLKSKEQLEQAKKHETSLRSFIIAQCFPKLKEGANKTEIDEYDIIATGKLNRKVSEAMLNTWAPEFRKMKINVDDLIRSEPALVLKEYRLLPDDKRRAFDRVLTTTEATPTLEVKIVDPEEK